METKPCVKCGSTDRYKPRPGKKTGACKACQKVINKTWHKANPEKHRARTKAWRKANPEREEANIKAWRKNNLEKRRAYVKTYEKNNPEKCAAHDMIGSAVRRGDLPRISTCDCVDCGIQATEYHHEDYSKPLDVEPLCRMCHIKRHNPDN